MTKRTSIAEIIEMIRQHLCGRPRSDLHPYDRGLQDAAWILQKQEKTIRQMRAALEKAVADYGKPGGPWNVPREPGTWIAMAKAALKASQEDGL